MDRKTFPDDLRGVWQLRDEGKISLAYERYLALGGRFDVKWESSTESKSDRLLGLGIAADDVLDFLLLEPSFLRNELKVHEADLLISRIETALSSAQIQSRYSLFFQKGLNAFVKSNFSKALDEFIQARASARTDAEKVGALFNLILCLESLGLDYRSHWSELRDGLNRLNNPYWNAHFGGKLDDLKARELFRSADVKKLLQLAQTAKPDDHLCYFFAWLAHHPLFCWFDTNQKEKSFLDRYLKQGGRWLSGYRLRTIKGLLVDSDLTSSVTIRAKIERLHLWVWRWLLKPSAESLEKICLLKSDIGRSVSQTLTYEEFQLLENSLRWLGLFANVRNDEANRILGRVTYSLGRSAETHEYERLALDGFFALRNGQPLIAKETFRAMKNHSVHRSRGFLLPVLVTSFQDGTQVSAGWEGLKRNLAELFAKDRTVLGNGIVVNAFEGSVTRVLGGKTSERIFSDSLVALTLLLKEKGTFTKAEVLKSCFGLSHYDALIHDPKVANCLTRANKFLDPMVRFRVRSERIVAEVQEENPIRYEGTSEHSALLSLQREPLFSASIATHSAVREAPHREIIEDFVKRWKTREDYEALLKVSKATATRRIQIWKKEKLILVQGRGKSCRYKMSAPLHAKLLSHWEEL